MSLVDHLSELRWRLFVIIAAVGVFSVVAFTRAERLLEILKAPLGDRRLYFTGLGDAFIIQLKIAIVVGLVAAMPVILFEVWRFISPGLTPEERRDGASVGPGRAALLRLRRRARLHRPALRARTTC